MEHRCAQGLCYQCDEKFFVDRRCKHLFVIEIHPDLANDTADNDNTAAIRIKPEISLATFIDIQPRLSETM